MVKSNIILNTLIFFCCISFSVTGCKGSSQKNNKEAYIIVEDYLFSEVKFETNSDYSDVIIKSQTLKFNNYTYKFKFIEDRTYLQYSVKEKVVSDWHQISYNFSYDNSFENAKNSIRILYNQNLHQGFLVLPGYTEEYPVFNIYSFNSNGIEYIENITTYKHGCFKNKTYKIQATLKKDKTIFNVLDGKNKIACNMINESKDHLLGDYDATDIKRINEGSSRVNKNIGLTGKYYATNSEFKNYGIELTIRNDSILYVESGDGGKLYNEYLLEEVKTENNKIFLKHAKTITGFTGDSDKLFYFGILYFSGNELLLESEYIKRRYGVEVTILEKM